MLGFEAVALAINTGVKIRRAIQPEEKWYIYVGDDDIAEWADESGFTSEFSMNWLFETDWEIVATPPQTKELTWEQIWEPFELYVQMTDKQKQEIKKELGYDE